MKSVNYDDQICDMYINGKTVKSIAWTLDLTVSQVVGVLTDNELI